MRLKLLFAAMLALLPVPALADVTAHYGVTGSPEKIVVAVDDGGNVRADITDKVAIIRRDGVDYILIADATGDFKIARFADVTAMMADQLKGEAKMPAATFLLTPAGEETVAGHMGTLFKFGPESPAGEEPGKRMIDVVISTDPALAPVGLFFHHLFEVGQPIFTLIAGEGNFGAVAADLFGKGTPLRVGKAFALESVDTADIPMERFELPGPVLEPMEFLAAITPPEGGGSLPPLP